MRRLILFAFLLLIIAFPSLCSAAITDTGVGCAVAATTCTISGIQAGDLAIAFAFRSATTAPTLPAGWTQIATNSVSSSSFRSACAVATTTSITVGTWTNATDLVIQVYRGTAAGTTANCLTTGIGATANTSSTTSTITYQVLSLQVTDGSSWVVGASGTSTTNCVGSLLTNKQTIGAGPQTKLSDTNAGVSSWANNGCTGTAGNSKTTTIELIASGGIVSITATAGVDITATGSSVTIASTTAGDLVIIGVNLRTATADTVTSITDANSDTFTRAGRSTNASGRSQEVWYCLSVGSAQTAVVVNFTTTGNTLSVTSFEYRSFIGALSLDQVATTTNATSSGSTTYTGPSITTAGTVELLFSYMTPNPNNVLSVASPWKASATSDGHTNIFATDIKAAAGTYAPVWTLDVADTGINNNVISFKAAPAITCGHTLPLMGAGCT